MYGESVSGKNQVCVGSFAPGARAAILKLLKFFDVINWNFALRAIANPSSPQHIESPTVPGNLPPARMLKVVEWLGTAPVVGICSFCGKRFKVPLTALVRTRDALDNLTMQFDNHVCNRKRGAA